MLKEVVGPEFRMVEAMSKICDGEIPPFFGWIIPGLLLLSVNSADMLDVIYIQQNKFHSKHHTSRDGFKTFLPSTIVFQASDDPNYTSNRKALSGAFFKSKLIAMTKIMKAVSLKEV